MERRAAGLIIYRKVCTEIEYLLLQASYGKHHWTPPKGYLKCGETDYEAGLRETFEESGYSADDLRIVPDFKKILQYEVSGSLKTVTYWLAKLCVDKPVTLSAEHQDYKWAKLSEACALASYHDFQKMLKECDEFISKTCD